VYTEKISSPLAQAAYWENGTSGIGITKSKETFMAIGTQERYREGKVATAIERRTAQIPSDTFLWAAGAAVLTSLVLKASRRNHDSLFVGSWAPTLLLLGVYNKLVKLHGSD